MQAAFLRATRSDGRDSLPKGARREPDTINERLRPLTNTGFARLRRKFTRTSFVPHWTPARNPGIRAEPLGLRRETVLLDENLAYKGKPIH